MNQNIKNLRIIIAILVVIIIGVVAYRFYMRDEEPITIWEEFSLGLGDWATDSDVPMDPNNPGNEVAWNITHSQDPTDPTNGIVRLYIDGSQDDGTIWIEQDFELTPNREYNGSISFRLYSETESFNQLAAVVGYVGPNDPETEEDLTVLGPANQVAGWHTYRHNLIFTTDSDGTAWVACGISVRWETEMIYLIDDLIIEFN
jgi:hypothetical protein